MAIFDPPHLENRSTNFDETSNLELPPEDHPARKNTYRCVNVGGLGEHPVCHCKFLSLSFLLSFLIPSARAQVAPVDRSAPKLARKCGFGQGCAFWGLDDDQSRLGVLTPKNKNFGDVNRHFKPNLQKNSNRHIFKTMHWISIKFERPM